MANEWVKDNVFVSCLSLFGNLPGCPRQQFPLKFHWSELVRQLVLIARFSKFLNK